jgi:hypothetical protein
MATQSGKWAITPENICGADSDFPPGRRKRDLKPRKYIGKYIGVALASPDRKITRYGFVALLIALRAIRAAPLACAGSGTHGYF